MKLWKLEKLRNFATSKLRNVMPRSEIQEEEKKSGERGKELLQLLQLPRPRPAKAQNDATNQNPKKGKKSSPQHRFATLRLQTPNSKLQTPKLRTPNSKLQKRRRPKSQTPKAKVPNERSPKVNEERSDDTTTTTQSHEHIYN